MKQRTAIQLPYPEIALEAAAVAREPAVVAVPPVMRPADIGAPLVTPVAPVAPPVRLEPSAPREMWRSESLHRRMLAVADVLGVGAVVVLLMSRFGLATGAAMAAVSVPVVLVLFKLAGLYNRDELSLGHSTLDEAPILIQLSALLVLGVAIARPMFAPGSMSALSMAALWGALFLVVFLGRLVARGVARRILPVERCLVVGDPAQLDRARERIAASHVRAEVVDFLPLVSGEAIRNRGLQLIRRRVREQRVHRIIVSPIPTAAEGTGDLIRIAKSIGVRVSVLPGPLHAVGLRTAFDGLEGMAMFGVPRFGLCPTSKLLKRGFDLLGCTLGLLAVSPVLAALAVAIKLDSRGPILFRQTRIGRGGQPFSIFKFRSMATDAEARKEELRKLSVAGPGLFKIENDPRVTRVGRLLRATSLDELPQLFNVMRGEMSLVGPRPLVTDEDAQVRGLDRSRLGVKPGMTGVWQVLGARVPLDQMVEIDYLYASSWTLWLDVKIVLRTVQHVLRRGNI